MLERRLSRIRGGFALFVVILMVAVLAVAGTVVIASTASTNSRNRAATALAELSLLNTRGQEFRLLYGGGTSNTFTKNPGRVSALTAPIIRPASCTGVYCELNTCGNQTFVEADVATWSTGSSSRFGPFLTHRLAQKNVGLPVADRFGFLSDTIYRAATPPTKTTTTGDAVWVNIRNVETADAQELDTRKDASDGSGAGTVRWSAAVSGQVTVFFQVAPSGTDPPGWAGC